jgi:hypothetical protein
MKEAPQEEKSKEFHSGITLKVLILSAIAVIIALFLIIEGNNRLQLFVFDPAGRVWFCYLPIFWGVLIIIALGVTIWSKLGKTITVDNTKVYVRKGNRHYPIPWAKLTFIPPAQKKGLFLNFMISDGLHFERIDDLFFPRYEEMLKLIRAYYNQVKKAYHL